MHSGPDTGVDNLHKVEGPGLLGGPGGPGPLKGRRKIKEKEKKDRKKREKEKKRGEKEKKRRGKSEKKGKK